MTKTIYEACIEKWGKEAQMDQAIEECAEFIVAINHFRRGRIGSDEVAEEVADVLLMMEQMAYLIGQDKILAATNAKVKRLQERLARA